MTKKAIKTKDATLVVARPSQAVRKKESAPTEALRSTFVDAVLTEASQAFSSEQQALDFLVSSITDKLGSAEGERSQMHEFLNLILETDPSLKEEILQGIAIRK